MIATGEPSSVSAKKCAGVSLAYKGPETAILKSLLLMKQPAQIQKLLVFTASTALAITALTAYSHDKHDKGGSHGTDIIHLSIQTRMENEGIATNASGSARLDWHQ